MAGKAGGTLSGPLDEVVFPTRRKRHETKACLSCCQRQGTVMQFIFNLIWQQSCSKYLAEIGQDEAQP
jgi:hypothetical protein